MLNDGLVRLVKNVAVFKTSCFEAHEIRTCLSLVDQNIEGKWLIRVEKCPISLFGPEVLFEF